jgi:hypothetical protein
MYIFFGAPLYNRLTWIYFGTGIHILKLLCVYSLHTDGVMEGNFWSTGRKWLSRQVSPDNNLNKLCSFQPTFVFVRHFHSNCIITFVGTLYHHANLSVSLSNREAAGSACAFIYYTGPNDRFIGKSQHQSVDQRLMWPFGKNNKKLTENLLLGCSTHIRQLEKEQIYIRVIFNIWRL